jgi:plastocyanin
MTPLQTSAHTHTVASMQMVSDSAQSSRTVILKHRGTVHVTIQNLAFGPAHLVVSPGTKVIWTNRDGFQHTTTSDRGLWDSGPINSGASFARLFKKVGTFTYHCTIHPFMHGTITVSK